MLKQIVVHDISFYQDDNTTPQKVDFAKMKASGAQGVIIRVGQRNYIDQDFSDYYRAAKGILPRGAYWFYDSREAPLKQARLFADALIAEGLPEMEVWGDYEENYGGAYKGWRNFAVFMAEVERLLPSCRVGVYTGYYYWRDNCPSMITNLPSYLWFRRFPLWIPWYTTNDTYVKIPGPWTSALYWQNTKSGDGLAAGVESKDIDCSFAQMTQDEFNARYAVVNTPPPVVVPPVTAGVYRIKDDIESGRFDPARHRLPSTVRLQGGKGTCLLSDKWLDYIYQIQDKPNYQFSSPHVMKDAVGWHNNGASNKVEQVVFSGNIVEVLRVDGNKAYIKTVPITDNPPMIGGDFVLVKPIGGSHALIHNFSIQYKDHLDLTTDGKFARTIVFCNPGESLWIDVKELKK